MCGTIICRSTSSASCTSRSGRILFGVVLTSALDIFICALGGWLADRIGAYRMFFCLTAVTALVSYPLFAYVLAAPASPGCSRLSSSPSPCSACSPAWRRACSPRSSGLGAVHRHGHLLQYRGHRFGGFSPLTITWMIHATGSDLVPGLLPDPPRFSPLAVVGGARTGIRRRAALHMSTAPGSISGCAPLHGPARNRRIPRRPTMR